jgi:anti-anti-sigma factor
VTVGDDDDLVEVRLLNLPVYIQRHAAEHHDALMREFALIRASSSSESLPRRLLALMDELQERFERFAKAPRAVLQTALTEGSTSVDVAYVVPTDLGEALVRLVELLDETDEYCRAGEHLVTLAATPIEVAYRHWFLDEFIRQLGGAPPEPWAIPDIEPTSERGWTTKVTAGEATISLVGELDLAAAPELRAHFNTLHSGGVRRFVLDTSQVSFIDSVGLSVILALYRRCKEEGGAVAISSPSQVMRRTLEVAGLFDVLDIID